MIEQLVEQLIIYFNVHNVFLGTRERKKMIFASCG